MTGLPARPRLGARLASWLLVAGLAGGVPPKAYGATTEDFVAYLKRELLDKDAQKAATIDLDLWLDKPGLPADAPRDDSPASGTQKPNSEPRPGPALAAWTSPPWGMRPSRGAPSSSFSARPAIRPVVRWRPVTCWRSPGAWRAAHSSWSRLWRASPC